MGSYGDSVIVQIFVFLIYGILVKNSSFEYKNSVVFPFMYQEQQYHSVNWKMGGRRGTATQRIYLSVSCPFSVFVYFIYLFIYLYFSFLPTVCEQRQGSAVLSSTTPWLSSKNRANQGNGHTASLDCITLPNDTLKTCTNTLLLEPCMSTTG